MRHPENWLEMVASGGLDSTFAHLYPGQQLSGVRARYAGAIRAFRELYGDRPAVLVSAPGRTEIGGNHTDHQHGRVLAAAVNLDIICVAALNSENIVRVQSKGYPVEVVDLRELRPRREEQETASALIRGVAAWLQRNGHAIGGFDAYTTSDVFGGSGLSSSAAFEVALGNLFKALYGAPVSPVDIAIAGKCAENEFYGKPSGLMDQMASSVGGFVRIDFADPEQPDIYPIKYSMEGSGYRLCIVNTRGSHADLTGEYAAVFEEMHAVAQHFGKEVLRDVDEAAFHRSIATLREAVGDRAVLRAMHFFADNALVPEMAAALDKGDFDAFLGMSIQSGRSSFGCLQNIFACSNPREQGLSLALALSESLLRGRGAWRVHGGGFAGTIQAFVPDDLLRQYRETMDAAFGDKACHVLSIRPAGGVQVNENLGRENG